MATSPEVEAFLVKVRARDAAKDIETQELERQENLRKNALEELASILTAWCAELTALGKPTTLKVERATSEYTLLIDGDSVIFKADLGKTNVVSVRHDNIIQRFEVQSKEGSHRWKTQDNAQIGGLSEFDNKQLATFILNEVFDKKLKSGK